MANKKRRRPQAPKSRSLMTRDMLLNMHSTRVPSAKAYKRPKSGALDFRSDY